MSERVSRVKYLSVVPRSGRDLMFVAVEDVPDITEYVLLTQLVVAHVHLII